MSDRRPRIVIIGGGFAGVKCARTLRRALGDTVEIVMFSLDNHMVFQPLLPDVAGSSLNPRAVAPPLRQLLPGVTCRTEEVRGIDLDASTLTHVGPDGGTHVMRYDHVVIACGNVVNLNLLPGMASHALPLKTIGDAIAMRAHVMQQLERADLAADDAQRRYFLTFLVVGGGFSGVEVAGELNDLIHGVRHLYPNVRGADVKVTLLHALPEILPEVRSPKLRRFALDRMLRAGIDVMTAVAVTEVSSRGARLADGRKIEGATIICTVGTTASALVASLDATRERNRLVTDDDTRVRGRANAWAIGDCALVRNARDGEYAPPTAQYGERMGRQCADNIVRAIRGEATKPFDYAPVGIACGIGGRKAVAEIFGIPFSGFIAWWLWRSSFLLKIPSLAQKLKVGIDWAWELVFPRDLSHFRPTQSDPIGRARFGIGETLFTRATPGKSLFAIESGEAEVVRRGDDGDDVVLATFGPGTLLGDATLAAFGFDDTSVRAKTALDVHTLGRDALTRLSRALSPIEAIIERAVNKPRISIWRHHPEAMRRLESVDVGAMRASYPMITASRDESIGVVFNRLIDEKHGVALVLDEAGKLAGIATRTDLLEALASGATADSAIGNAMNRRPVSVRRDEPAARAAERMADEGWKFLPVVDAGDRPVAVLTADDFVRFALMPSNAAPTAAA